MKDRGHVITDPSGSGIVTGLPGDTQTLPRRETGTDAQRIRWVALPALIGPFLFPLVLPFILPALVLPSVLPLRGVFV